MWQSCDNLVQFKYTYINSLNEVTTMHLPFVECDNDTYGPGCKYDCKCQHGASCDHISGACICTEGWRGMFCEKPCPDGFFGFECQGICSCENGARCDPVTGDCSCAAGWEGTGCKKPCPAGYWGKECKQVNKTVYLHK